MEKIEIRELYEFQLFELGALGEAVPVGEPRRSLETTVSFDDEHHGIRSDQLYALRRRRIKIDDTGIAEYRWRDSFRAGKPTATDSKERAGANRGIVTWPLEVWHRDSANGKLVNTNFSVESLVLVAQTDALT